MAVHTTSALMETAVLNALLDDPRMASRLRLLDASYHIPPSLRQARDEFQQQHLPGARFFEIDAIADTASSLPHMLPSSASFSAHMAALGIDNDSLVVVYDVHGMMSAPRAWWTFRYFGHENVFVLNGGLPKWLAEGRPVVGPAASDGCDARAIPANPYIATPNPDWVRSAAQVAAGLFADASSKAGSPQILDMRSAGRFTGTAPEPRAGLRSGRIPGSMNQPWGQWLSADQTLLSPEALEAACDDRGLDWRRPVICTCGSGITACVGALALYELGNRQTSVYDGSWAEWGARNDLPIVSGEDPA